MTKLIAISAAFAASLLGLSWAWSGMETLIGDSLGLDIFLFVYVALALCLGGLYLVIRISSQPHFEHVYRSQTNVFVKVCLYPPLTTTLWDCVFMVTPVIYLLILGLNAVAPTADSFSTELAFGAFICAPIAAIRFVFSMITRQFRKALP